jgi:uncharacterized protein (DUF849 family)
MKKIILETVIRCGRTKKHRVLNVTTGEIYSVDYNSREEAETAAKKEHGTKRHGRVVVFTPIEKLQVAIDVCREIEEKTTSYDKVNISPEDQFIAEIRQLARSWDSWETGK